jgi:hypothetical protein
LANRTFVAFNNDAAEVEASVDSLAQEKLRLFLIEQRTRHA